MNDDKLNAIAAEIERQNQTMKELETALLSLGDVELAVPKAFFEELEELCAAGVNQTVVLPAFGIRG